MTTREGLRKMGPLPADHPLVVWTEGGGPNPCPGCEKHFAAGDYVTLITIGPGHYEDERRRCREGKAYNAVAIPVHWACATGEET